ncbi:unnamed protein product [Owenia fusiformis]|uniref:Uncharacterized protein n=1 Tax=Owenia fusiformis TaxID=6347 RepID=A0A8J1XXQ9_OWEFU|nr:unnamed protein product [Owenia fusiformis]
MDRSSRSELVKTIEEQREKIERYEKRLRDLVAAYKGTLKEKEALQETLSALTVSQPEPPPPTTGSQPQNADSPDNQASGDSDQDHPLQDNSTKGATRDVDQMTTEVLHLKEKLATLTNSLSTLMQEKSTMEKKYQSEKKTMRQAHEEQVSRLENELATQNNVNMEIQDMANEAKSKLIQHQREREKEQIDHAATMRELQRLVAAERMSKEYFEQQVDTLKEKLSEYKDVPDPAVEYQEKIDKMNEEMETVRRRLKQSEEKASEPSPLLLQLQTEMAEMKAHHRIAVQQEQMRANKAEESMRLVAEQGEERVCGLESKLSELSEVVGNYERLRYQDQLAISKLRDRVTQLDLENTALARAAHTSPDDPDLLNDDDKNLDIQALVEKMVKLKGMLKLANERSEKPVNVEELLKTIDISVVEETNVHKHCQEEYTCLKEEFEKYKLRAQSVLKTKTTKDPGVAKETDVLRNQVLELKDRIRGLLTNSEEEEKSHRKTVEDLRKSIASIQDRHEEELKQAENDYRGRASELEEELHKHRDRTIALLIEKDREIEAIKRHRSNSPGPYTTDISSGFTFKRATSQSDSESDSASAPESSSVSQLFIRSPHNTPSQGEVSLLHFNQEQARREVEIQNLRKQKHSTESALRDLQLSSVAKAEKLNEHIDSLKEEIRKLERNKSRESANLEYLKNVVYQYMVCKETTGKKQMLRAIATILQFSPKEERAVHEYIVRWWGYSM